MKRNVSVVTFKFRCNIVISDKIIKEMSGSVASGTPCTIAVCVQCKTPDDEQRNCPKHVEFYYKNKFEKLMNASSWFYYKNLQ